MIKLVIHCSDIHIRNYQRFNEYADQLEKFVNKCKDLTHGYDKSEVRILICGDLVHSKNQISNELMVFCSFFLRQLEEIATVLVVAGNHDLIVNNTSRTDTLTGLFNTANFTDCKFIDSMLNYNSGLIADDNIIWCLYSIYSNYEKPVINEDIGSDKTVVGLYHGMIVGASLNNGSVINDGVNRSMFDGCRCVMAGDIHKRQVLKYGDVDIVYPGSLIQQTFGESVSQHGFVVWNIENMTYEFIDLDTEYGLYDIEINDISDFDKDEERLINP